MEMIATDMDGTLLNDGRSVSEENIKAIEEAQRAGINVIVATGRDYTEAVTPLKEAGLKLPLICVNGADIRREDGQIIHQQTLNLDVFKQMNAILTKEDIYFEMYTTKGAYTNDDQKGIDLIVDLLLSTGDFSSYDQAMQLAEKRFQEGAINRAKDYQALLEENSHIQLLKLLAFSKDEVSRERAKHQMEKELDVAISASARDNLEITHHEATKGSGIEIMSNHYGINLSETMAIGDNFNDVSMMKQAGYSVAMGNAEQEIKRICDHTTKKNTDNGVAHAIRSVIPHLQK
ncbi:hydrolase [Salipaludibacillus keqinensis]|uniref:Hydrolase n=1 Tax=Salipaludibacillus keqinensis TaxID=2045207 RepID=A0A323TMM9_9BACI|nr:hydrolase [Salipaludibacillus keqinensis]